AKVRTGWGVPSTVTVTLSDSSSRSVSKQTRSSGWWVISPVSNPTPFTHGSSCGLTAPESGPISSFAAAERLAAPGPDPVIIARPPSSDREQIGAVDQDGDLVAGEVQVLVLAEHLRGRVEVHRGADAVELAWRSHESQVDDVDDAGLG